MAKAIPELSIDTQTVERLLLTVPVGETVTYTIISALIGRNVQAQARYVLASAIKRVRKQSNMVFAAVRNEGVKRLDDAGKIANAQGHIRKGRTQAKLARAKTTAVDDYDALPNRLKVEHNMVLVQAGAMLHFTSAGTQKKIAGRIQEPKQVLPLRECLDSMKSTL